eukprot:2326855-Pyramimonas_sp.AAC.1
MASRRPILPPRGPKRAARRPPTRPVDADTIDLPHGCWTYVRVIVFSGAKAADKVSTLAPRRPNLIHRGPQDGP